MRNAVGMLTVVLSLSLSLILLLSVAAPLFAAKKTAKGCFFVGGHPAAQSETLLKKAVELYASGGDAALQQMRSEETVIVPPSGAVSKVSCADGGNCQIEFRGKQWWIQKSGLQCD